MDWSRWQPLDPKSDPMDLVEAAPLIVLQQPDHMNHWVRKIDRNENGFLVECECEETYRVEDV